jgi:thiol-disulfide isomerase/thioredoxin
MTRRVLVALVALLALAGCATGKDAVERGTDFQFVAPGGKTTIFYEGADRKHAPDLTGESVLDQGEQLKVSDFADKVVVINIWGTWCGPCRAESAQLEQVYRQTAASGVQVLGIDVRDEPRSAPQDFLRDNGLTYPSIYDPSGRSLLNLSGYPRNTVPSTIVLDRQHRVAAVYLVALLAGDLLPEVQKLTNEH